LHALREFKADGFVDLQNEASRWGIEEKSLRKLSALVLGERVSKAQRLSNWEAGTLTEQQRDYAATDAWVCLKILEGLRREKPILDQELTIISTTGQQPQKSKHGKRDTHTNMPTETSKQTKAKRVHRWAHKRDKQREANTAKQ
jgi:ribonuclease D